jgi:hypothetical protein
MGEKMTMVVWLVAPNFYDLAGRHRTLTDGFPKMKPVAF